MYENAPMNFLLHKRFLAFIGFLQRPQFLKGLLVEKLGLGWSGTWRFFTSRIQRVEMGVLSLLHHFFL